MADGSEAPTEGCHGQPARSDKIKSATLPCYSLIGCGLNSPLRRLFTFHAGTHCAYTFLISVAIVHTQSCLYSPKRHAEPREIPFPICRDDDHHTFAGTLGTGL
jgi:hypothetical protein